MPDQNTPRKGLSPRITTVPGKLVFILVWWLGGFLVALPFRYVELPEVPAAALTLSTAWDLAFLILGAQIFRARGEAIAPVRPWWQATGRAKASRALGALTAIGAASGLLGLIASIITGDWVLNPYGSAYVILTYSVVAAFYLNSASRLKAPGAGAPPPLKVPRAGRIV